MTKNPKLSRSTLGQNNVISVACEL